MALKRGIVPKFLQRRAFDMLMFGYVDAIVSSFPTVGIRKAIVLFRAKYQLAITDFNEESAYTTYNRMKAELKQYDRERNASA